MWAPVKRIRWVKRSRRRVGIHAPVLGSAGDTLTLEGCDDAVDAVWLGNEDSAFGKFVLGGMYACRDDNDRHTGPEPGRKPRQLQPVVPARQLDIGDQSGDIAIEQFGRCLRRGHRQRIVTVVDQAIDKIKKQNDLVFDDKNPSSGTHCTTPCDHARKGKEAGGPSVAAGRSMAADMVSN